MKILLDECVDANLAKEIADFEVSTVQREGWSGLENGDLLRAMGRRFDVFLTIDSNIPYQNDMSKLDFALVMLRPISSKLSDLKPLLPQLLDALRDLPENGLVVIQSP